MTNKENSRASKQIQNLQAKVLTEEVKEILRIKVGGDLARYLEFQGAAQIKKDFSELSKDQLTLVLQAKRNLLSAKKEIIESQQNDLYRERIAESQNTDTSLDFRSLDLQVGTSGQISVETNDNWCTDSDTVLSKMRLTYKDQYDLVCITLSDGQIYASSFNK